MFQPMQGSFQNFSPGGANASDPNNRGASITILLYKYHISYHIFKGKANEFLGGANQFLGGGGKTVMDYYCQNVSTHGSSSADQLKKIHGAEEDPQVEKF